MVALPGSLVASLAVLASVDVGLDLRAEARTSAVDSPSAPALTRQGWATRPGAAVRFEAVPVRLTTAYSARVWTSDVEARPAPLVTHEAQLRLDTYHARPWRAGARASAARGWTDPLADPVAALQAPDPTQTASLVPIAFEAVRAGVDIAVPLDLRTTVAAEASVSRSASVHPEDRGTLPPQARATAGLSLSRRTSERSTLRGAAGASALRTTHPTGTDDTGWGTASVTWRTRITQSLEGWAGAGGLVSIRDTSDAAARTGAAPVWDAGLTYARGRAEAELSTRAVPFTDRFTGDVSVLMLGAGALRWRATPSLSFAAGASGGAIPSGETALASLDVRGRYAVRDRLGVEVGLVGRWQREERPGVPSFAELGVVAAVAWDGSSFERAPPHSRAAEVD